MRRLVVDWDEPITYHPGIAPSMAEGEANLVNHGEVLEARWAVVGCLGCRHPRLLQRHPKERLCRLGT